ncbi:MAG: RecX family transcriptional regulator [Saprospiraceae bacterium]|nr:RecX family transcriptional regulator [Saprospiraceae bacterium]
MDLVALAKMQKYCAYQERCQKEVRSKLIALKVYGDDLEEIMAELISSGFLNEGRFAEAYARGKFKNNKWGMQKIRRELKWRNISAYDIDHALASIPEDVYHACLRKLLRAKYQSLRIDDPWQKKQRTVRYAQNKGYELPLILTLMSDLEANEPS